MFFHISYLLGIGYLSVDIIIPRNAWYVNRKYKLNGNKIQLEEVYTATGLDKNLSAGQTSSNLFSQAVDHTGYAYIDVYTIFPAGSNRKMITLYKNGSEIKRYDDTTGTSGIGSKISVSAFIPIIAGDTITAQIFCATGGMSTSDVRIMAFY